MIHSRPSLASQTSAGSPCGSRAGDQPDKMPPRNFPSHSRGWETESTSSEAKSSSSSKYRPTWRPKRESLNIDSIFSKDKRKHCGYTQLRTFPEDAGEQRIRQQVSSQIQLIYVFKNPVFFSIAGKEHFYSDVMFFEDRTPMNNV